MTTDAPSSAWRTAIRAEASRTDAGGVSATAAPANCRLASLSSYFRPAVSDQLVYQAAIRRNVSEKPPHTLRRGAAPFNLGFGELGYVGHVRMVSAGQDPYPSPSAAWNGPCSASKAAISSSETSRSSLPSIARQEVVSM